MLILFSLHVIWVGEAFTGNCEVVSTYAVCAAELCFGHGRQLPAFSQGPSVSSSYPARDMLVRRRTGEEKKDMSATARSQPELREAALSSSEVLTVSVLLSVPGPQNGWNDPPALNRAAKKKKVF